MTEVTNRKSIITESAGPASYATGGFTVEVPELALVDISKAIQMTGIYKASVDSVSGNKATVKVYEVNQPVNEGGSATYTVTLKEVAAGTDLSAETVTLLSYGL